MGQEFELSIYLAALKRRLWIVAIIFLIGTMIAGAVAAILPPSFKATSVILVKSQQIPTELARSTVTDGSEERLAQIRNQLTSRENLLDTADRLNLFPELAQTAPLERAAKVLEGLELTPTLVNPRARYPTPVDTVQITYTTNSAWLAARVANDFASQILERNLSSRIERASETTDFFNQELARIEAALKETSARIAEFKKANEATLPDTLPIRREELLTLRERRFELDRAKIDLTEEKRNLTVTIEAAEAGVVTPGIEETRRLTPSEQSLAAAQIEYESQRAIYADSHPRMRVLLRRIEALRRTVAAEAGASAPPANATDGPVIPPAQRIQIAQAKARISEIDREIELLNKRNEEIENREAELATSIRQTPEVELTLNDMLREQVDLKAQYEEVVAKLAEAQIGEQLELSRQAERFEIIERAEPPTRPEKPKRFLILAAGSGASLVLGIAIVVLLELLNKTIRTVAEFEHKLGEHPFAVIPYISTAQDVRRRWTTRIAGLAAFVGVSLGAAYGVDKYYMPIDQVMDKVMDRSGVATVVELLRKRLDG